jgi:hypothetical protein
MPAGLLAMLDLDDIDGSVHVRCDVTAYQFSTSRADDWCLVRVVVAQGADSFEKVDPALEAGDILRIRDWFRALAEDRLPRYAHLDFIEPCLSFEFLGATSEGVRLAVHLGAELRPPFPLRQLSHVSDDWAVVFVLASAQLHAVADACEEAGRRLPVRSR